MPTPVYARWAPGPPRVRSTCQPLQPCLPNTESHSRPSPPHPQQVWLDRATGHVVRDTEDEPWQLFEQRMTRVHGFTCSRARRRAAAAQQDDRSSGGEAGVQGGVQGAAGGVGGGQEAAAVEAFGDGGEDEQANNEEVFVCTFQKLPP